MTDAETESKAIVAFLRERAAYWLLAAEKTPDRENRIAFAARHSSLSREAHMIEHGAHLNPETPNAG